MLSNEEVVPGGREEVFDQIALPRGGGWLFDAACDQLRVGAVVRLQLPVSLGPGETGLAGTGRVVALHRPHRLLIEQYAPWPAQLACTVTAAAPAAGRPHCRVRLVATVPERAVAWLLRRRGVTLPPEATPDEQPIGLLMSQSGPASTLAGATEQLAQLAVEEINADGPPLGRPLRLVVGDDGSTSAHTVLEAARLVDAERCPVVIAAVSCPSFDAASRVLRRRPALLIFAFANEGGPAGDRLIRLGERPDAQLKAAVSDVMSRADGRRWFLAGPDISWPRAMNSYARPILDQANATIVGERLVVRGTGDFSALIEAIGRAQAECVLSTFYGADAVAFERAFHASGLRTGCRTLAPAVDDVTLEHIGADAGAGIWSVAGYFQQLDTTENRAFRRTYRKRFGPFAPPLSNWSVAVYETVHIVAMAARRAASWHPTDVGRAMTATRFHGPRGPIVLRAPDELQQELFLAEATGDRYAVHEAAGQPYNTT